MLKAGLKCDCISLLVNASHDSLTIASKLPEDDFYIKVNREGFTNAPPEVLYFLQALKTRRQKAFVIIGGDGGGCQA